MTRRSSLTKPEKPRPDFPLSAHANGQWVKKIYGKLYYFGPWDDPLGAEDEYNRQMPVICGQEESSDTLTITELCNEFLLAKKHMVDRGALKQRTWDEYKAAADRWCRAIGPRRPVESLASRDFQAVLEALPKTWGLESTNGFIVKIKAILNFAYNEELIDRPIRTGTSFKRATAKEMRISRASRESKFFHAHEIHTLLNGASRQFKAMILCGVNLGFTNIDCASLEKSRLDLADGWYAHMRPKTGVMRVGKLWPETIEALQWVLDHPRRLCPPELDQRVFVTEHGGEYIRPGNDEISKQFRKLAKRVEVSRRGVGFASLRHVTQTVGEGCGDLVAVRVLMGHVDSSISAVYREHFDRDRVKLVSDHIREWFLAGKNQKS
ncbi:MAG: hypothetical protein AAFU85_16355 [Planctomycetota bacterium]